MLVTTRAEWFSACDGLAPDAPVLCQLATNGLRPWAPGARLVGLGFCAPQRVWYVPLAHGGQTNAVPDLLHDVLAFIEHRALWVDDVYEFTAHVYARLKLVPMVAWDYRLARNVLRTRLPKAGIMFTPSQPLAAVTETPEAFEHALRGTLLYGDIATVGKALDEHGLRMLYDSDLAAAQVLARHAVMGYGRTDQRLYPTWHLAHESGSTLVTSADPPISSTRQTDRWQFPADPHCRWVELKWRAPEVVILAALSDDPWLREASQNERPYSPFALLWNVDEDQARDWFLSLTTTGPHEAAFIKRGGTADALDVLKGRAVNWVRWAARVEEEAVMHGYVTTLLGRPVPVPEPRKACTLAHQTAQATMLKLLIARVAAVADQQPHVWANFHALLPVHSKIYYQIDAHIPVWSHAREARRLLVLYPATNAPMAGDVAMGPTWGQLTPILDDDARIQVALNLMQPGTFPLKCPVCGGVAPDEPTLREHLADDHEMEDVEAAIVWAREHVVADE